MKIQFAYHPDAAVLSLFELEDLLSDDVEAMDSLADLFLGDLKSNLQGGAFIPDLPETVARKARLGQGNRTLYATGSLAEHLQKKVKRHKARATRGAGDEWVYGFFHALGIGRNEKRDWVTFGAGTPTAAFGIYDSFVSRRLGEWTS